MVKCWYICYVGVGGCLVVVGPAGEVGLEAAAEPPHPRPPLLTQARHLALVPAQAHPGQFCEAYNELEKLKKCKKYQPL